jgi:hypothetical protein
MFTNKHTFHLWKEHPRISAVHTQLAHAADNSGKLQPVRGYAQ